MDDNLDTQQNTSGDFNSFTQSWTQTTPEPEHNWQEPDNTQRVYEYADTIYAQPELKPVKKTNKGVFVFLAILTVLIVSAIVLMCVAAFNGVRTDDFAGDISDNQSNQMQLNQQPTPKVDYSVDDDNILSIPQIVNKVAPSVVGIQTNIGAGSGIIMSTNGYILTNAHVVDGSESISVIDYNDKTYQATLVGQDNQTDIAVLKVEADDLIACEFGDSDVLEVGETAVAIGNPTGMELYGTVTSGIISANNRTIYVDGRNITLIQTDASINPGNSGGPLINHFGQVVGVTSIKISSNQYEGLGFALPINTVLPIVQELKTHGYVTGRPLLGITGQDIDTRTAWYYNIPSGVYVQSVSEKSDAAVKGLKQGDVITAIDGYAISSITELSNQVSSHKAGDTVTLSVYRSNRYYQIDVVLMSNE